MIQDAGHRTQAKGYGGIQNTGCWNQDTGYRILDTITDGYRMKDKGYRIQDTG